jgi:hypothetical protein
MASPNHELTVLYYTGIDWKKCRRRRAPVSAPGHSSLVVGGWAAARWVARGGGIHSATALSRGDPTGGKFQRNDVLCALTSRQDEDAMLDFTTTRMAKKIVVELRIH